MPGMNVRGDQHLNFTPDEAAAWLGRGEVRHRAPHADNNDDAIAGMIGVVALLVVLAIIGVAITGSTPRQMTSNVSGTSVQPSNAFRERFVAASNSREYSFAHSLYAGRLVLRPLAGRTSVEE